MRPNSAHHHHHHHQPPKLKAPPRPLFSCAFFRHCSHPSLSPTSSSPPPRPSAPPPPPPPPPPSAQPSSSSCPPPPTKKLSSSSSSSSSASTSQSFTQWKFPVPSSPPPTLPQPPSSDATLPEAFHAVELHLSSSNPCTQLSALHAIERALPSTTNHDRPSSDPSAAVVTCPHSLMHAVIARIRGGNAAPGVKRSAAKILLSLCLSEPNRRVAVEAGAVGAVVEGAVEMAEESAVAAERALAALELMCTVREGADEVRGHALVVLAMVGVMGRVEGRGREHAMGVLAVALGGGGAGRKDHAVPSVAAGTVLAEEVAKAVELALKGECSERGRRKGTQLLKLLRELNGNSDGNDGDGGGCRGSLSPDSNADGNYA